MATLDELYELRLRMQQVHKYLRVATIDLNAQIEVVEGGTPNPPPPNPQLFTVPAPQLRQNPLLFSQTLRALLTTLQTEILPLETP